jgi:ribonuclease R
MPKKKKINKPAQRNSTQIKTYKGVLDVSRSGMGFVVVEQLKTDIRVRPNDFGKALHGDTVRVQATTGGNLNKRLDGKVIEVVERKQIRFSGRMQIMNHTAFFEPASQKPIPDFYIPQENVQSAKDGDRVVVKLVRWDKDDRRPIGMVETILDARNEGDMAMKEILVDAGFPLQFDQEVLDEADALADAITPAEEKRRRDFRPILTFTIDPVDARDFDDALSYRILDDGITEIGIHIADVSHFVKPGSLLDDEAYRRATSVYLPDRVNPMLPERISNELCSLRPHEDKYTFSAVFQFDQSGKIVHRWIGRTLIHSDHRFTYEDVQQIIETQQGLYATEILHLNKLARQYRQQRFDKGAINFSSSEVRFTLDENGVPIGIQVKESKESHQLIEEFMLMANRAVAEHIGAIEVDGKPIPFPYRIHDTPNEEKLIPFASFAAKFGYRFDLHNEKEVAASFNRLLADVAGKPEQHVLEQLGIRTMSKAIYTAENIGHYGLGFLHYCHFTSPIRRYPDVIVHRILQQCLDGKPVVEKKMEVWCRHSSERERAAMEAERAGNKYKQVEYMRPHLGETFDGVISGVAAFGFWVETIEHKCEGLISIQDLGHYDEFTHDESDYALVGLFTKKRFRMGDTVRIRVVGANLDKRQLDYAWIPDEPMPERKGNGRSKN